MALDGPRPNVICYACKISARPEDALSRGVLILTEAGILTPGQSAAPYLRPRDRTKARAIDIGSLDAGYESEEAKEADTLFWESAFGLCSAFDGTKFEGILKDYEVYFTEVPPLELGRFPSPLGISHEQREENYRAHINQVLDDLK